MRGADASMFRIPRYVNLVGRSAQFSFFLFSLPSFEQTSDYEDEVSSLSYHQPNLDHGQESQHSKDQGLRPRSLENAAYTEGSPGKAV